jgi:hypothetical protein
MNILTFITVLILYVVIKIFIVISTGAIIGWI